MSTVKTLAAGHVRYERRGGIGYITLARPEKLNALSEDMSYALREAIDLIDLDDEAQIGIIAGEGRAFCAGADVTQHMRSDAERAQSRLGSPRQDLFYNSNNWKPLIAATHGYAVGAGLGLAIRSDFLVAGADTMFQVAEIPRGIAGSGLWAVLAFRGLGSFADEVTLTGRKFTAEEALRAGVVNQVAPAGQHLAIAEEWARRIIANPPAGVRDAVKMRRLYLQTHVRDAVTFARLGADLHYTTDYQDGIKRFAGVSKAKK